MAARRRGRWCQAAASLDVRPVHNSLRPPRTRTPLARAAARALSLQGLIVSVTLTLQFNLFTESPFDFVFPTALFLLCLLGSIALALAASYWPARAVGRRPIASVVKGRI